jgi:sulfite reductase (NADPH) hemoprotein beta-component
VRQNNDPLLSVFSPIRAGQLVSVTTSSSVLIPSIAHLYKLANYPVVIHVALSPANCPDISPITAIRNSGWTFLQSESLREAQDMAITAHALAVRSGKGVIHFFSPSHLSQDTPIAPEDSRLVEQILDIDAVRRFQSAASPGNSIYVDDGHVAVSSDGHEAPLDQSTPSLHSLVVDGTSTISKDSSQASVQSTGDQSTPSTPRTTLSTVPSVDLLPAAVTSEDVYKYATSIWSELENATGRKYSPFEFSGPANAENCIFVFGPNTALFALH